MQVGNAKLNRRPRARHNTRNARLSVVRKSAKAGSPGEVVGSLPLWIYELETAFGITGSTAQSASKRTFYPRNFNQPSYTFRGQTHNEHEYTELAEFIREGQLGTIYADRLFIIDVPAAGPTSEVVNTVRRGKDGPSRRRRINRNLKGRRPGIKLQGYIGTAQRTHERWVNAPEYEFAFIVSRSLAGPILDEAVKAHVLPTNWNQFVTRGNTQLITDPDIALLDKDSKPSRPNPRIEDHGEDDTDDYNPPGWGTPNIPFR